MQEFSVAELSKILSAVFKNAFPDMIAVTGEVSGLTRQNSGHIYFSLKENDVTLSATYFKFYQTAGSFIPKNGDKVKVIGELKTYDKYSQYQINVRKITYDSEGLLWKQFEETKKKLEAEGLFREERKREIPKYPYRVAVLTSTFFTDYMQTTEMRLLTTEKDPEVENGIILKNFLYDGYDIKVSFNTDNPLQPLLEMEPQVVGSTAEAFQGSVWGDDKLRVMNTTGAISYYNVCQNFFFQYMTFYVNGVGTVGTYANVVEWISKEEYDYLKKQGY